MKYEDAKKFYEEFKSMDLKESTELIMAAKSKEEQLFYMKMSDYFLQARQKEYINKPFER